MRRHSWVPAVLPDITGDASRCRHCLTERCRDESTKSLYAFRGGNALQPNRKPLPPDQWSFFVSGVIPECVERS